MGTHYNGTKAERLALNTYIKLSRAADAVTQRINAHLHDYDLTVSQFGALEALYHLGPLTTGTLAQKILKSSGNLTLVVDNLVKRGLVTRQRRPDDRRRVEINLTADGRALIEGIWPAHLAGVVEEIGVLSADEQKRLGELCRTIGMKQ